MHTFAFIPFFSVILLVNGATLVLNFFIACKLHSCLIYVS